MLFKFIGMESGLYCSITLFSQQTSAYSESKVHWAHSLPGQPYSYGYKLPIFSLPANSISVTSDYLMISQTFLLLRRVTLLENQVSFHTCFPELVACGAAVPESFGVWHKDGNLSSTGSSISQRIAISVKRQNKWCMVPFSPDHNEPHGCRNEENVLVGNTKAYFPTGKFGKKKDILLCEWLQEDERHN